MDRSRSNIRRFISLRKIALFALIVWLPVALAITQSDVGIYTNSLAVGKAGIADSSSVLDLTSLTKGILLPRMNTTQRDAISSPATGLEIFNTSTGSFEFYDGSAWKKVGSGDMVGPASATDGALAVWDGTTGKLLKNSTILATAVATLSGSQTLTNKSIDADSNTLTNLVIANFKTVAANITKALRFDGSGALQVVDFPSTVKNYFATLFFGDSVANINTYNDGASATPTDGTGGTVAGLTTASVTSTQLRASTGKNIRFSKDASNRQGGGWSYDFTVDTADRSGGQPIYISFRYETTSAYASGDFRVFVYDKIAGTLLNVYDATSANHDGSIQASTNPTLFTAYFTPTSGDDQYRLIFHTTSTNASAWDFDWIDGTIKAQSQVPVPVQTPWVSYTPTLTGFGTATNVSFMSRRNGPNLEVHGTWVNGTVPSSTLGGITLGYQGVNSNVTTSAIIPTVSGGGINVGTVVTSKSSTTQFGTYVLTGPSTSSVFFGSQISTQGSIVADNSADFAASSGKMAVDFSVPISGWDVGAMLSTDAMVQQMPPPITATSSTKTPTASGNYAAMSSNALVLTTGTWTLKSFIDATQSGSAAYSDIGVGWYAANGADTSSQPAALSTVSGLTILSANATDFVARTTPTSATLSLWRAAGSDVTVKCTSATCTVYLVPLASMTTAANARITVYANAVKVPDFTTYSFYPKQPTYSIVTPSSHTGGFSANGSGTYTPPAGATRLEIEMVGPGGGGGGASGSGGTTGGNGSAGASDTTFGTSLLIAGKGGAGLGGSSGSGGASGTVTLNSPAIEIASIAGSSGADGMVGAVQNVTALGGDGGTNPIGSYGKGGHGVQSPGGNAAIGAGGGGGSSYNNTTSGTAERGGGGGGSGAYIKAMLQNLAASYSYNCGAGGSGGTAGTNGGAGGNGGDCKIIVKEFY